MKVLLLIVTLALILTGCGKSETVTIGEKGEKGILRRDIDTSKDTANGMSEKIKQGNKDAFGG
jgi:hypothetical protein